MRWVEFEERRGQLLGSGPRLVTTTLGWLGRGWRWGSRQLGRRVTQVRVSALLPLHRQLLEFLQAVRWGLGLGEG